MLRIVLTGPESSGKTTLAQHLAAHFRAPWVPEYARTFLKKLKGPYQETDLLKIARGQIYLETRIIEGTPPLVFYDTDLRTIKIWSEHKYGRTDDWVLQQISERQYHHYLLCRPDIPWEPDPLREHPDQRDELYQIYLHELQSANVPFTEVFGDLTSRMTMVIQLVEQWLLSPPA